MYSLNICGFLTSRNINVNIYILVFIKLLFKGLGFSFIFLCIFLKFKNNYLICWI